MPFVCIDGNHGCEREHLLGIFGAPTRVCNSSEEGNTSQKGHSMSKTMTTPAPTKSAPSAMTALAHRHEPRTVAGKAVADFLKRLTLRDAGDLRRELAVLRRAAARPVGEDLDGWQVIQETLGSIGYHAPGDDVQATPTERVVGVTLELYAMHARTTEHPYDPTLSFGAALGKLRTSDERHAAGITRRFRAIVQSASPDRIIYLARQLVSLLGNIGFDYPAFADDVLYAQQEAGRRRVAIRWSRDYYQSTTPTNTKKANK